MLIGGRVLEPVRLQRAEAPSCAPGRRGPRHPALPSLGVRTVFVAHWVDNAFAGAALEGGAKGVFINAMERLQTGHYFRTGPCPQAGQGEEVAFSLPLAAVLGGPFPALAPLLQDAAPVYPPGRQCNVKGLTSIGDYLVRRLMANHMLIEADHLSERARLRVLAIAEEQSYARLEPYGHRRPLDRLRPDVSTESAASAPPRWKTRPRWCPGSRNCVGTGSGAASSASASARTPGLQRAGPDPDAAANPLRYPFRSYDRKVSSGASEAVSAASI